jgi:hypothetical protein
MPVVGYPTKAKGVRLLGAFCGGAGGRIVEWIPHELEPGAAAFYGVIDETRGLWRQATRDNRERYYIDGSPFDACREAYFRIARNAVQPSGERESDCRRFDRLRIPVRPWRTSGTHIVVCPQSDSFMRTFAEDGGDWLADTLAQLRQHTDRPLRIREWSRDKASAAATLAADLAGAWALVTFSSAAAVTALLEGIPAISTAPWASAHRMGGSLDAIESPLMLDDRREWAGALADQQFTVPEMESGAAWKALRDH